MSYQFPQQQAPRRKGGGRMFFLVLLGVGAFLIFSRLGNGPVGGKGQGQRQGSSDPIEDGYAAQREAILGPDEPESKIGKRMPSTGGTGAAAGWDIEDVATKEHNATSIETTANTARPAKTKNGDWAIEEVDAKKKKPESQFKFSTESNPPVPKPGGDWAIEEVTPKANAKTQKGDWVIEETN